MAYSTFDKTYNSHEAANALIHWLLGQGWRVERSSTWVDSATYTVLKFTIPGRVPYSGQLIVYPTGYIRMRAGLDSRVFGTPEEFKKFCKEITT